jgi:hypothetical protein
VAAKQTPSGSQYVVKLAKQQREAAVSRLEKLGDVEELKGRSDLALLRLHGQSDDPRKMWQEARQALGDAASVQPVLLDPNGAPQFPTGEVTVRFQSKLTDEELRRFAEANGLRLRQRNEFAAEQAVFEVLEPARYLPDVVDELSKNSATRLAWANTVAAFDRH